MFVPYHKNYRSILRLQLKSWYTHPLTWYRPCGLPSAILFCISRIIPHRMIVSLELCMAWQSHIHVLHHFRTMSRIKLESDRFENGEARLDFSSKLVGSGVVRKFWDFTIGFLLCQTLHTFAGGDLQFAIGIHAKAITVTTGPVHGAVDTEAQEAIVCLKGEVRSAPFQRDSTSSWTYAVPNTVSLLEQYFPFNVCPKTACKSRWGGRERGGEERKERKGRKTQMKWYQNRKNTQED
jgi:hypothetical protein